MENIKNYKNIKRFPVFGIKNKILNFIYSKYSRKNNITKIPISIKDISYSLNEKENSIKKAIYRLKNISLIETIKIDKTKQIYFKISEEIIFFLEEYKNKNDYKNNNVNEKIFFNSYIMKKINKINYEYLKLHTSLTWTKL